MDRVTHCPNCFNDLKPGPRCPQCGFDTATYEGANNQVLPPFTPLAGGRYLVGRQLGEGGFGVVYAGLARRLKRLVAIKEFFPYGSGLAERRGTTVIGRSSRQPLFDDWKKRFLLEAELLGQFNHPRLVQVHDIVEGDHNTAYLIMERLRGQTLNEHLGVWLVRGEFPKAARTLPSDQGLRLLYGALEALEALHDHAPPVIHRDLAPGNLFLVGGEIERLKVLDFGLARTGEVTPGMAQRVTQAGHPDFAPPEQQGLSSCAITPATDFYTLGASLYLALAGVPPPNLMQRYQQQPWSAVPPLPGVNPALAQVISACLEINPDQRPQTVEEIRRRLAVETIIVPPSLEPPPPLNPPPEPLPPPPEPAYQPPPAPEPLPPIPPAPDPPTSAPLAPELLLRKAADQGDAVAQCALGMMYDIGRGVEQSDTQAMDWYRKAAEQGHAIAQLNLGWMYANGRGVEQSDTQAIAWFQKAADQGDEIAKSELSRLRNRKWSHNFQ